MEGSFSVREGSWKALFSTGSGGGFSQPAGSPVGPEESGGQLYDLSVDPEETRNLWDEEPERRRRMFEHLREVVASDADIVRDE